MDSIGVRELRQHASRYLRRVANGESVQITDRGRPVAQLVPISGDAWSDLVASGRVTPAEDAADVVDEAPRDYDLEASEILTEMRSQER